MRVWNFISASQRWLFYDPARELAPFNALRTLDPASLPARVAIINVTKGQRFRVYTLYAGWNYIPIMTQSWAPEPGGNVQDLRQTSRPLMENGALQRVRWFDSRR